MAENIHIVGLAWGGVTDFTQHPKTSVSPQFPPWPLSRPWLHFPPTRSHLVTEVVVSHAERSKSGVPRQGFAERSCPGDVQGVPRGKQLREGCVVGHGGRESHGLRCAEPPRAQDAHRACLLEARGRRFVRRFVTKALPVMQRPYIFREKRGSLDYGYPGYVCHTQREEQEAVNAGSWLVEWPYCCCAAGVTFVAAAYLPYKPVPLVVCADCPTNISTVSMHMLGLHVQ